MKKNSTQYKVKKGLDYLAEEFNDSDDIYIVANGGFGLAVITLPTIALDFSPKLESKINSLDSQCLITSVANDYGYNNVFLRWLELQKVTGKMSDNPMIIGLSCSGNSKNIVLFTLGQKQRLQNALISELKVQFLPDGR